MPNAPPWWSHIGRAVIAAGTVDRRVRVLAASDGIWRTPAPTARDCAHGRPGAAPRPAHYSASCLWAARWSASAGAAHAGRRIRGAKRPCSRSTASTAVRGVALGCGTATSTAVLRRRLDKASWLHAPLTRCGLSARKCAAGCRRTPACACPRRPAGARRRPIWCCTGGGRRMFALLTALPRAVRDSVIVRPPSRTCPSCFLSRAVPP